MKKLLFIVLGTMFCLCQVNAQSEEEVDDFVEVPENYNGAADTAAVVHSKHLLPPTYAEEKATLNAQLQEVSSLISQLKDMTLKGDTAIDLSVPEYIYMPIRGKSKFSKRHYIYQTLDISPSVSGDHDPDLPEQTSNGQDVDEDQVANQTALGLNFGYSLIFVPGRVVDDQLRLNRMGFAYNVGLVASFSRQEKYGTTCNFLLKTGIEAGNGHMMGIGLDILGGYGKSSGDEYLTIYKEGDDDDLANPYTEWCWQYGAQLWLRSNLLSTAVKNSEMLIFARFVRSVNPHDYTHEHVSDSYAYDDFWKEENWMFGVTLRYKF